MATIVKPVRPGTVIQIVGERITRIRPSFAETVAIPLIHDWGPMGADPAGERGKDGGPQLLASFSEWGQTFGDGDTQGRTAVAGAFQGQGLPGTSGAGGVLAYRMGTAAAAKATISINNTAGTPAAALRLDAKYKGTRGNDISYSIAPDPADASRDQLKIRFRGIVQETYTYAEADTASVIASINRRSNLVTATALAGAGVALAPTAGVSLAGGDNGESLTATEWLAAFDALEFGQFTLLAPFNLTDSGILASLLSWIRTQAGANRPVMAVVGGAAGETIDDAVTRSAALNDEHLVNVGVGTYHDDLLDKDLSTAQLAPRIAGVLAAKGEEHSATFAKLGGLHVVGETGPASDAIEVAVQNGVVVLSRAMSTEAELKVEKGVTTFTDDDVDSKPLDVYGDARLVRVLDIFTRRQKQWGDDIVIGDLPVNDDTRSLVYGHVRDSIDDLLARGLILPEDPDRDIPAPYVSVEPPDDPNLLDSIPYDFGWQFAYTTNYIFGNGTVR